jgi:Domain of Unknown Function (DUF1206)
VTSLELAHKSKPAREVAPWVKWLARIGMMCSALLWLVVGALAVGVAVGAGGEPTDRTGALNEIGKQTWGKVLLIVLAVGFAGYAVWRFTAAVLGCKVETNEELGWGKRLWHAARGCFYAFLCYTTVAILLGSHSDSNEKQHTEAILDWPGGRWVVGALGLGVVAWGIGSVYRAVSRSFKDELHTEKMSTSARRWTTRAGVVGYLARAVVLVLIGVFLVRAAHDYDPDEAVGLDGALQKLAQQTYGTLLLGVVAAGIVVYGLFYLVRAAYREV